MIGVALCAILLLRPRGILGEERVVSRHLGKLPRAARRRAACNQREDLRCRKFLTASRSATDLSISRLVCGLWQVADLEKDGTTLDPERGADALEAYAEGRLRHVRHGRPLWQRRADHRPAAGALPRRRAAAARLHQMVPGARADDGGRSCARACRSGSTGSASTRSTCCSSTGGRSSIRPGSTRCTRWRG